MHKDVLVAILEYYKGKRNELGYDKIFNKSYPRIKSTDDLLEHISLVGIKIHYANVFGGRSVGLSFDCTWDAENGIGVRLNNEQVIDIGTKIWLSRWHNNKFKKYDY